MSTDYDRTLMTVSSLLAGLFPPKDYQIWSNDSLGMNWQPISIHTNDIKNDNVINFINTYKEKIVRYG